jgi:hypothetical protein
MNVLFCSKDRRNFLLSTVARYLCRITENVAGAYSFRKKMGRNRAEIAAWLWVLIARDCKQCFCSLVSQYCRLGTEGEKGDPVALQRETRV